MTQDHSPRPVRSFVSNLFGFARPRPPARTSNADRQSQPSVGASSTSSTHAPLQQPSTTANALTHIPSCVGTTRIDSRPIGHLYNTPATNLDLPASQCREERDPVHQLPQAEHVNPRLPHMIKPDSSVSICHQYSQVDPALSPYSPPRQSRDVQPPTPGFPQLGEVPTPGFMRGQLSPNKSPSRPHTKGPDMFYQAHDFVIKDSVFLDNSSSSSDNFMASLLKHTILGAEFDSSDPNMPLRCHPGTRSEIIKRCQDFILDRESRPSLRWVVGAAGVGKSAIMQSVVHDESRVLSDVTVGATIFFSINGRQDGTKAITTIAYQLAVKLHPYRHFLQREVTNDPSLLQKSLPTQFRQFILKPFIQERIPNCPPSLLIVVDGLDECANPLTQLELLSLIFDVCVRYPTSPIVWMVASRPEPHITTFFSQLKVALFYEKEEILVDTDDAHKDVTLYLRDKFKEIKMASITLQHLPQWPSPRDFSKIAEASGGLFAYASTVARYISDPTCGDPVSQIDDVLEIIETGTNANISGEDHPMAQLDALYAHILSKIPAKAMANARKLLLLHAVGWDLNTFHFNCNMLGMTQNAAYGATHHIRSIAKIPGPDEAEDTHFKFFHKSFPDYLRDFKRSGFSPNIESEAEQLLCQCVLRIFKEAPDGSHIGGVGDDDLKLKMYGGILKNGPGTGDKISVSWPGVGGVDQMLRFRIFRGAVWWAEVGFERRAEAFRNILCMRALTTSFAVVNHHFPLEAFPDFVFDETRRQELLNYGILRQIPLETLKHRQNSHHELVRIRFRTPTIGLPDPWNAACDHKRTGSWEGHSRDWLTSFLWQPHRDASSCDYCFQRFVQCQTHLPGQLVTICDLTPAYWMGELRFVDPADDTSEWIYHFLVTSDQNRDVTGKEK